MNRAIALALALVPIAVQAQDIGPGGGGIDYDPEAGTYLVRYLDTAYDSVGWRVGEPTVPRTAVYFPGDRADPRVSVAVEPEESGLRYHYVVGNGPAGRLPLFGLTVYAESETTSPTTPDSTWTTGWPRGTLHPDWNKTFGHDWANTMRFNPDGSYGVLGVPPGETEGGFSFWGAGLPAIVDAEADSDAGYGFYEGNGPFDIAWGELADSLWALEQRTQSLPFRTLGPRAIPDPLDGPVFLDTLAADLAEADVLGWLGGSGGAVAAHFGAARAAWAAADSATAAAEIEAAVALASGDGGVRPEGHALVTYNGTFLLSVLPEPSGSLPVLPDVRPILECVAEHAGAGVLTAYFGYENRSGERGRVPYGPNNRITPSAYDGAQPDVFDVPNAVAGRPGRTPWYPGHAFTVEFGPADQVVWTLLGRTSTASAGSARCPE
jgi:hypothetical protein